MSEVIRFNYLYRDSGNYKEFGSKIFGNPDQLSYEEIERKILENLIDTEFFYPDQVGIKKFEFHHYLNDFTWYEYEFIEIIDATIPSIKDSESINNFILNLHIMKSKIAI